jgi:hypothetical protein
MTTCTKHVNSPCENEATEVLHVRNPGNAQWQTFPRCADHPAAADIAMIGRVDPAAETMVKRVYTECPKCGSEDICQDYVDLRPVRTYGWVCDHCGHSWDVEDEPESGI